MDNQKIEAILDRLLKLSEEGKLDWKRTASEKTFLLALNDGSITISGEYDEGQILYFRDEKGMVVEQIVMNYEDSTYRKFFKLYELARRKATNADATLDRILEQLNSDKIAA